MSKVIRLHISTGRYLFATFILFFTALATSQTVPSKASASPVTTASPEMKPGSGGTPDEYKLGPDDQVVITVMFADELNNKTVRIDSSGYINIPFAGRVHAATLTVRELERDLTIKLKPYFASPNVVVNVAEY